MYVLVMCFVNMCIPCSLVTCCVPYREEACCLIKMLCVWFWWNSDSAVWNLLSMMLSGGKEDCLPPCRLYQGSLIHLVLWAALFYSHVFIVLQSCLHCFSVIFALFFSHLCIVFLSSLHCFTVIFALFSGHLCIVLQSSLRCFSVIFALFFSHLCIVLLSSLHCFTVMFALFYSHLCIVLQSSLHCFTVIFALFYSQFVIFVAPECQVNKQLELFFVLPQLLSLKHTGFYSHSVQKSDSQLEMFLLVPFAVHHCLILLATGFSTLDHLFGYCGTHVNRRVFTLLVSTVWSFIVYLSVQKKEKCHGVNGISEKKEYCWLYFTFGI